MGRANPKRFAVFRAVRKTHYGTRPPMSAGPGRARRRAQSAQNRQLDKL